MSDYDRELLALLRTLPPEEVANVIETLPYSSIQPLLGLLGSGDGRKMPASPLQQARELDPKYVTRPHLEVLSDAIVEAIGRTRAGEDQKLAVAMPPRHGKTELSSIYTPLWILRQDHKAKIGLISHSPSLAITWGRKIRRLVERHGAQLGLSIAPDAGAVSEWETPEGGVVMSRSIGQALAGVGFTHLIIDDPTRDFAAAHSDDTREALWAWYINNVVTRLEPPSFLMLVQTRWHEDDLTGRVLSAEHEGDPDEWRQIVIPAIAEKGKPDALGREPGEPLLSPLIPDETPEDAVKRLAKLRRSIGGYAWAAQFQQQPAPARGAILETSWWHFWTDNPADETDDGRYRYLDLGSATGRVVDSWDATFKDTKASDYVVGQRWLKSGANRFLLDQRRGRMSFTKTIAEVLAFAESGPLHDRVHERFIEDKANGPAIISSLRDKVPGLKPVNPLGSKEARARAITPEIESGNVYLPDPRMPGYEWVRELIAEAQVFPNGSHDDQVDAMTQALAQLRETGASVITSPARPSGRPSSPIAAKLAAPVPRNLGANASRGSAARRVG